MADRLRIL